MQREAKGQEGRVTRGQLLKLGFSGDEIDGLVRCGQLTIEHRGVYAIGQPPWALRGTLWSAVLACGPGSLISHRSAAYLDGYLPLPAHLDAVHITIRSKNGRGRPGIIVHRGRNISSADIKYLDGLPVTRAARTMLDLAASESESTFEQAFDEAAFRHDLRRAQMEDVLARNAGAKGSRRLRALWEAEQENRRNRLEAEKRMAALIKAAKLPDPLPNEPIRALTADFFWPEHRVIVETDGFGTHGKRASFESDRARDADLESRGYSVLRFTWRQITREPFVVVARLAARLALSEREQGLA